MLLPCPIIKNEVINQAAQGFPFWHIYPLQVFSVRAETVVALQSYYQPSFSRVAIWLCTKLYLIKCLFLTAFCYYMDVYQLTVRGFFLSFFKLKMTLVQFLKKKIAIFPVSTWYCVYFTPNIYQNGKDIANNIKPANTLEIRRREFSFSVWKQITELHGFFWKKTKKNRVSFLQSHQVISTCVQCGCFGCCRGSQMLLENVCLGNWISDLFSWRL